MKFNYKDIALSKKNLKGDLAILQMLIHHFMSDDFKNETDEFATEDGNYELKLTVVGKTEKQLDVSKLIKWMSSYGEDLEKENQKLNDSISNIRWKINNVIDEELNN